MEVPYNTENINFTGQIVYPTIIEIDGKKYIKYYWDGQESVTLVPIPEVYP